VPGGRVPAHSSSVRGFVPEKRHPWARAALEWRAAKSDRVLYIEDGSIKGEYVFGKYKGQEENREREKKLSVWLMEMGF
jgi:hypothetical protein